MKELFTIQEAADEIGIPIRTAYYWINENRIPYKRLDKNHVLMTASNVKVVIAVLEKYGRKGIKEGLCVQGQQ